MIKILLLLFFIFHSYAAKIEKLPPQHEWKEKNISQPKNCNLTVDFGSYGTGINHKAFKNIQTYIENSKSIKKATQWSWGLEGEVRVCLQADKESWDKIFQDIKKMIPERSKKGPTSIKVKEGKTFKSKWPN